MRTGVRRVLLHLLRKEANVHPGHSLKFEGMNRLAVVQFSDRMDIFLKARIREIEQAAEARAAELGQTPEAACTDPGRSEYSRQRTQ